MGETPLEGRLIEECEALSELASSVTWLQDAAFTQGSNGLLTWSFTLVTPDRSIPLQLVFPALFPDLPPFVLPADDTVRLSQHQYGTGGELCLQYRPDNWHPDCRSTDVVRSAKVLLDATPATELRSEVESDHPADFAFLLSIYPRRFMLSPETARLLRIRLAGRVTELRLTLEQRIGSTDADNAQVARVASIGYEAGLRVPGDGPGFGGNVVEGVLYRLPDIRVLPDLATQEAGDQLYLLLPQWLRGMISRTADMLVVLSNGAQEVLIRVRYQGKERTIDLFRTFEPPRSKERRVQGQMFRQSSVCIIGAGSLGSKVAAGLTREGVGRFVLLDNDVLWADNLVRNELDEMDVGHHKAISLQHRLFRLNPRARVSALRISLTSQSTVQNIEQLGDIVSSCDLVIDTTADSGVFRMAAAICTKRKKPLAWARVYAGGIGGLVARSVPHEDPPPMTAASQLRAWCDARGQVPPEGREHDYGVQADDQEEPLIASDGDVGVLANRLVRHALDAISPPERRVHPEPAYYVGLRKGWIFDHPFDTHPVVYGPHDGWGVGGGGDDGSGIQKILEYLEIDNDA
ncbi:ThiF family adenylyltransferase [Gymnodinialimonas ulvae]|uniref:ThiF family adenylyltransferase n=1 Tax=Gymnodinialimonas ulvae TaxID=3126504 RepID=UPI0030B2749E